MLIQHLAMWFSDDSHTKDLIPSLRCKINKAHAGLICLVYNSAHYNVVILFSERLVSDYRSVS